MNKMAVSESTSKKVKWHIGLPERGTVIVLVYWIDSLEEWSARLVKVNNEIRNIIASSQETDRPCQWLFAPEQACKWVRMTKEERDAVMEREWQESHR